MIQFSRGGATLLRPFDQSFVTYDLEFIDNGSTIDLVSIGMVSGDGRELYAVNREMDQRNLLNHDWMRKNVWPSLPLKDLPEKRSGRDLWGEGEYVKTCRCSPVSSTETQSRGDLDYACTHMNGRLDMDHPDVRPMGQIRRLISDFLLESHSNWMDEDTDRDGIQMWAWYGAYDHVRLAQCWGPMINLPSHIPMLTHDLKSEAMRLGNPVMPEQEIIGEHNALDDARHNLTRATFLWNLATDEENA